MRVGSLFSGIGGLELGLEWAGVGHTVWQVEKDPYCRAVLAKHWPDATRYDDVCTVGAHNLEPVDVICGGYPCQPFSTAGLRKGSDDARHLWPQFARIIREMAPCYVVLENVANHIAIGFSDVLGDLADLGYDAEWRVLYASDAGAPQRRARLFAIAYPRGERVKGLLTRGSHGTTWGPGFSGSRGSRFMRKLADAPFEPGDSWPTPLLRVVDDGIPLRLAKRRVHALGNAVVPHVAEVVGRRLLAIDAERRGVAA